MPATIHNLQQKVGARGELRFQEESVFATTRNPRAKKLLIPFREGSENIQTNYNVYDDSTVRADRMLDDSREGFFRTAGSFEVAFKTHGFPTLLKHALGKYSGAGTSIAGSKYRHLLQVDTSAGELFPAINVAGSTGTGDVVPSFSLEKVFKGGYGGSSKYALLEGSRMNAVDLEVPLEGNAFARFEVATVKETASDSETITSPVSATDSDDTFPFAAFDGRCWFRSTGVISAGTRELTNVAPSAAFPAAYWKGGTMRIDNGIITSNIAAQRHAFNNLETIRRITGTVALSFIDFTHYNWFLDPSNNQKSLILQFENMSNEAHADYRAIEIALPRVKFLGDQSASPTFSTNGTLDIVLPFRALRDLSVGYDVVARIINAALSI